MKQVSGSRPTAEQPVSVFPIVEESLGIVHSALTAAGAFAQPASLNGVELATNCPNAIALLSSVAAAVAGQRARGADAAV